MARNHHTPRTCTICGKSYPPRELFPAETVRGALSELILKDHPAWSGEGFICRMDLARYNSQFVRSLLASEKGEVDSLEEEVLASLRQHELLTTNIDAEFEQERTLGERLADRLAALGGSWGFLSAFAAFVAAWIVMNALVLWWRPVDPYPFILLNLVLSCLAAIQAPVIMMSQKRQEARDRLRSQHDYQVNLKAELEIRHLHEKIDHLLTHQWQRLVEIQEVQLELLAALGQAR